MLSLLSKNDNTSQKLHLCKNTLANEYLQVTKILLLTNSYETKHKCSILQEKIKLANGCNNGEGAFTTVTPQVSDLSI